MSTTEQKQQTPTPAEIPFTTPQAMSRYVTDTGKILPRKYVQARNNLCPANANRCLVPPSGLEPEYAV